MPWTCQGLIFNFSEGVGEMIYNVFMVNDISQLKFMPNLGVNIIFVKIKYLTFSWMLFKNNRTKVVQFIMFGMECFH